MSKTIAVVGATGNQGQSVIRAFLPHKDWHIRALTRNPSSNAAKELASKGCEVVAADLNDQTSLEKAFEGSQAIFVNTDFWQPYATALKTGKDRHEAYQIGMAEEVKHAKNATLAAIKVDSLEKFIYSALGPMKEASKGKFPYCGHWDAKAAAADYMETVPQLKGKLSFIYPGAYHTNSFLLPHWDEEAKEYITMLPGPVSMHFPVIDTVETFGLLTYSLIEEPESSVKLFAHDCNPSIQDALDAWEKITGKEARFVYKPMEEMHEITGLPYEVLNGPAFLAEYHFMDGVKGKVINPEDLKLRVPTKSIEQILRDRGMDDILGDKHPEL